MAKKKGNSSKKKLGNSSWKKEKACNVFKVNKKKQAKQMAKVVATSLKKNIDGKCHLDKNNSAFHTIRDLVQTNSTHKPNNSVKENKKQSRNLDQTDVDNALQLFKKL